MIKKIFNWSLCLTLVGVLAVSCQKDVEQAEIDVTQEAVSPLDVDYSAYANDPRTRGCRIVTPKSDVVARGAGATSLLWNPGQTITVSFIGGTDFLHEKIEEFAKKWEDYANLTFDFVENNGMIRVSFIEDAGSYSYLGIGALSAASNSETMNFGWFDENTDDTEFSRTVVHEFGHVLGLIHEHQHPEVSLDWDEEFIYDYYTGYPNYWSEEDIFVNILGRYNPADLTYTDYDINSIMHYPFAGEFINSNEDTPNNTELSEGDKEIAGILYPF